MFKYNVTIKKVSGKLNESVLPKRNLVYKSKTKKTNEQIFKECAKFYKKKYGLVIESAYVQEDVSSILNSSIGQQVFRDLRQSLKQYHSLGDNRDTSAESVKQTLEAIFVQLSNSARRVKSMISSISK